MAENQTALNLNTTTVQNGESVRTAEAKLLRMHYRIVVTMNIINATKWPMTNPRCYAHGGVIVVQPSEISSGCKEMMVMRKRYRLPTGSYGTVSWDINGKQVIVMWSAPFNFDFYSNTLAVGISENDDNNHSEGSFHEMYREDKDYFTREEYRNSTRNIVKAVDNFICVRGSMSTTHKPVVQIVVSPFNDRERSSGLYEPPPSYRSDYR